MSVILRRFAPQNDKSSKSEWRSTSWHDRFGFPAVTLMLLASFVIIYFILRVLPGRVRLVHRVLG
jgi:hypothetical protein